MNMYAQLSLSEASTLMLVVDDVDISAHLDVLTSSSTHTQVCGDVLEDDTVEDMIIAFDDIMTDTHT